MSQDIKIARAKGRPMLTWVGKRPLNHVRAYPAQQIERYGTANPQGSPADWNDWPESYEPGGLLFHGDNKDVLAHLLANGFRGKVKLIYIDPPFDSGADYVRKVQLRGVKGTQKLDGEEYTLGEQIQYTDIWANDNYLQFMYERLLMLRELLADDGSIYLHCDSSRGHYLKILLDEVFGFENFRNELIWRRVAGRSDSSTYNNVHDLIFFVSKTSKFGWTPQFTEHSDQYIESKYAKSSLEGRRYTLDNLTSPNPRPNMTYEWKGHAPPQNGWRYSREKMEELDSKGRIWYPSDKEKRPRLVRFLDESEGVPLRSIWNDINPVNSQSEDRSGYPTQKPDALLERIVRASSLPGDIILDCFIGSGTTAAVAQKLGRRWIGCDINKGAIQTTAKRLAGIIAAQSAQSPQQSLPETQTEAEAPPCQLSFSTWRVNDYDLQIQHNEAVELACEYIGITRKRSDAFFEGVRGQKLVKIIPFNHPLTPLDIESIRDELKKRPDEDRDIEIVCLGMELAAQAALESHNRNRPVNRLSLIELRTDPKYGGFIKHEPLHAQFHCHREGDKLVVEVTDAISPSIIKRLNLEEGLFRAQIDDWRAQIDCVLIDTDYDGQTFNVALADVPARKSDLVRGHYDELPAPAPGTTIAVKLIDMLGEELILTQQLD